MIKTLTLLILTAVVMASIACGPSAEEKRRLMLCEDALERVKTITSRIDEAHIYGARVGYVNGEGMAHTVVDWRNDLTEAKADKAKYCK